MSLNSPVFESIITQYVDYVYVLSYRILGNADDTADAVQETFIKLHSHFENYDEKKNLKNWICTIALNCARDIYRKRKRDADAAYDTDFYEDEKALSESGIVNKIFARHILQALPFNQRTVMVMFYIERMSIKEIAQAFKRPEVLIKVWLHRSRAMLLKKFGDAFL